MLDDDGEEARERYDAIVADNKGSIETLVGEIRRQLESRTTKTTRGQRRGLLDQRNLWKHRTNPRVFMVEDRPAKPHAAVSLLIDASGSMGSGPRSRAFYATEAGIVLAEVMDKLGFAFEVVDFNSMYGGTYKAGYTAMNVRKPFEGQMNQVSKAAIATDHTGRENSDGHAVEWCIKRVQKQEATHRFVFTISDGQPAGPCPDDCGTPSEHLTRIVQGCPDDVQIFSVGIAGMDTSRYYDNSVSVGNTAELGEKILPVLRKMLGQMRVVA
jgi:cobalamin biosynthesis protein CobT